MNRLPFYLLLLSLFVSACKENEYGTIILSEDICLRLEDMGDSVQLRWNVPYVVGFDYYYVERSTTSEKDYWRDIYYTDDQDNTEFVDRYYPVCDTVFYRISVVADIRKKSDVAMLTRNVKMLNIFANDAVFDQSAEKIYLVGPYPDVVNVLNAKTGELCGNIPLSFSPMFLALGNNGSGKELYVSGNDKNIEIFSCTDYSHVKTITTQAKVLSIASMNNDRLVCSHYTSVDPLRTYGRASGSLLYSSGSTYSSRIWLKPGSSFLYQIGINVVQKKLEKFTLNSEGDFLASETFQNPLNIELSPNILRFSENDLYFITSAAGLLFTNKMEFIRKLGTYPYSYNDFAFDETAEYVYAADHLNRRIDKFKTTGNEGVVESIKCISYPAFIYCYNNEILVLGYVTDQNRSWSYDIYSKLVLERFDAF